MKMESEEKKIIENARDGDFEQELGISAKSSAKIIKNSKGVNWEVKVVKGEEKLISEIVSATIKQHRRMEEEFGFD